MLLTTKSGRVVEMPTDEENALIEAGIASDVDTYELSAAEFSQLKHIGRPSAALLIQKNAYHRRINVINTFPIKSIFSCVVAKGCTNLSLSCPSSR